MATFRIKLGQEVKDRVSGFKGIAVGRTEYLQGCLRVLVQPKLDKDGKLVDSMSFDEPDLVVTGDGVYEPPKTKPKKPLHGPRPELTRAPGPTRRR